MSDGGRAVSEKRKPDQNDDVETGSQKKAREVNGEGAAVTEEEVDEFFAIVRRIHVAVDYFKKSKGVGEGRNLTNRGAFEWELTNAENNGVTEVMTTVTNDAQKVLGLDLNADPATDP
ncbi:protein NIM1-INTERACTING 2-like [Mangifera indica]|uniref:protein NIM1-INTERACTING 2-like n=1 Tax=Mangifera indica TaxID=29780 RepID=UPI001CF9776A|nr:protein NIM1-INTERACTING 2-like [Mangifera indica]